MSLVLALADLRPDQVKQKTRRASAGITNTTFFRASIEAPDSPTAFLGQSVPGRWSSPHFHAVDQFQIIVAGSGRFGRHEVFPHSIHFSRAYTPYGPLVSGPQTGWTYLTLRTRHDPGAQLLPAAREKLNQISGRRPWQITRKITFPGEGPDICLQDIPEFKDEQGLFTYSLTMAPHARTTAPDPAAGDGQFIVVCKGSLLHDDREHRALAVVFVKPAEDAFLICAGPRGLQALVLNFPQVGPRASSAWSPSPAAGFRKWQCSLCSFAYDEALGMPEEGIAAGVRWQDVPDSWSCPDCSAGKNDFQIVEV